MKNGANAVAYTRINSDDGPTSVFILGDTKKRTIRQRFQQFRYNRKKKRVEKTITGEVHHSMEEVLAFAVDECGLTELDRDCAKVREEYRQLRASFIVQYQPELLREYAEIPALDSEEPDAVKAYLEKCKEQLQRAMAVPEERYRELISTLCR